MTTAAPPDRNPLPAFENSSSVFALGGRQAGSAAFVCRDSTPLPYDQLQTSRASALTSCSDRVLFG